MGEARTNLSTGRFFVLSFSMRGPFLYILTIMVPAKKPIHVKM